MKLEINKAYRTNYTDYDYNETSEAYIYVISSESEDNYEAYVLSIFRNRLSFEKINIFMGLEGELSDDYGNFTSIEEVPESVLVKYIYSVKYNRH